MRMTQNRLKGSASEGLMDAFDRTPIIHIDGSIPFTLENRVVPSVGECVELIDVYTAPFALKTPSVLYDLLAERGPEVNINHNEMPPWRAHLAFIESQPYNSWYLIRVEDCIVGAVYLTKNDEIGIFIFKLCQRRGFGSAAVKRIIEQHSRKCYFANINSANKKSIAMFKRMGFRKIRETTYKLEF